MVREAVVLVPENAAAGKINGKQLAARAPLHGAPGSASAAGVVARIEARHSDPRSARKGADDFRLVRCALHLRVGARVMLTQNRIWGAPTVSLGLMNGARGWLSPLFMLPPRLCQGSELTAVPARAQGALAQRWARLLDVRRAAQSLTSWRCTSPSTRAQLASMACPGPGCPSPAPRCATTPTCRCAWRGLSPSISRKV